jgi:hypothetical protein
MHKDKFVFAQLVSFLDRNKFNYIVRTYRGDRYVKHFTCWNQLLALMFGQLSNRESLRDLVVALDAHRSKCYHLGLGRNTSKTSLARANQTRDYRIFEEFAYFLVNEAQQKRAADIFSLGGNVYAFDSTTIDLCLSVFWWAKFRRRKGGIKVHTLYDVETQIPAFFHITEASVHDSKVMKEIPYEPGSYYIFDRAYNNFKMLYKIHQIGAYFVIRAKNNLQYRSIKWKRRLPRNVLSDLTIGLTGFYPKQYYPESLRLVRYWDELQQREFVFLTNATHISALQVAELYKNRWQVELFFKWLKQHLKIKKSWGTTENAVRIQIYAAICTYCLVAIVQHDMKLERSTYEVLQILSITLTDKTNLRELFSKTKFQNDKERNRLNGPNLFNF